jgi:hypothetical protein
MPPLKSPSIGKLNHFMSMYYRRVECTSTQVRIVANVRTQLPHGGAKAGNTKLGKGLAAAKPNGGGSILATQAYQSIFSQRTPANSR